MIFDWYKIFNLTDFLATGLVSKNLTFSLDGLGKKEILITRGNEVSVLFEGTFLTVEFEGKNPYSRDDYAVYKDAASDIWLGIAVPS